ncbi:hypothetical protein [Chryseobacterium balustinum]|uniref:hypothetical protein n=1 Tax=Chryseobacterium balustinum TaxID=246 RepID=UPI003CE84330
MKKLLLLSLLILCALYQSQTFQEVTKIGSYYGKTFKEFEDAMNMVPFDKDSKFGIESRGYKTQTYSLVLSETDDNDLIGKYLFLGKKDLEHEETWYNIVKYANENKECVFIDSFYGDKITDDYKYKISLNEMLPLLRNNKDTSETIYYIVYKYKDLYYHFCIVNGAFMIRFEKEYKPLKK